VDLRKVSLSSLRSQLALVSQEIVIFDQTVAENIACGRLGASRDQVIEAAKQANAHEFIMRLANQYDTPLGERGVNLSGGQRQRIAIARAFVRQAPILIFDEATASLDSKAELEVQKALSHMPKDQTVVVIAHRLSTLQFCDRIDVFSDGRIVESGTFEELLKARGAFLSMAEKQGFR
jgi:ABC-type multidrug transport system fused ATPase/permease subunit